MRRTVWKWWRRWRSCVTDWSSPGEVIFWGGRDHRAEWTLTPWSLCFQSAVPERSPGLRLQRRQQGSGGKTGRKQTKTTTSWHSCSSERCWKTEMVHSGFCKLQTAWLKVYRWSRAPSVGWYCNYLRLSKAQTWNTNLNIILCGPTELHMPVVGRQYFFFFFFNDSCRPSGPRSERSAAEGERSRGPGQTGSP